MQPTVDQLKLYFSGTYHHASYEETVAAAMALRVHADGIYPGELIECRRPNESEMVREYRKQIFKPITKPYFGKIITSLNKIRRSTEWSVRFEAEAVPPRIIEGESLEDYLMVNFPKFGSLTNWAFGFLLREYCIDANGYVALIPVNNAGTGEYLQPFPHLFRADQVVEATDSLLVTLSDEKSIYNTTEGQEYGEVYYVITDESIQRWEQIGSGRRFGLVYDYLHGLGEMPAFHMKGRALRSVGDQFINESRLADIVPRFDEALREYSDLQAGVVQHLYPEKWEYGDEECEACSGRGYVSHPGFNSQQSLCNACNGTKHAPRGPYTTMIVKAPMAGEAGVPTPPMGYAQKDTVVITLQDTRVDKHIQHGLAAISMEHVMESPLNQSGLAKAYDDDELNTFANAIAEDIVSIMDEVAYFTNELRYSIIVPDYDTRQAMLPNIAVPEKFDLFSAQMVETQLASAKTNKTNPVILNAMEIDYANKKFSADPSVRDRLALTLQLDPLPNISEDDKVMRLQNGGITKETYIISSNISQYIDRAFDEKGNGFIDLDVKDQKALLLSYAKEQTDAADTTKQIISTAFPETAPAA